MTPAAAPAATPGAVADAVFETPRLVVRRMRPEDVDALLAVYGDAGAMRWVGDGEPLAREDCVRWVEVTHRNYALRGYGMFTALLRETGAVIGFGGLVHPDGQPEAELKYALLRSAWGQGLATELARGMLGLAQGPLGLARVCATAAPANAASHRVLVKAGMQLGELRRNDDGSFTQVFAWTP